MNTALLFGCHGKLHSGMEQDRSRTCSPKHSELKVKSLWESALNTGHCWMRRSGGLWYRVPAGIQAFSEWMIFSPHTDSLCCPALVFSHADIRGRRCDQDHRWAVIWQEQDAEWKINKYREQSNTTHSNITLMRDKELRASVHTGRSLTKRLFRNHDNY